MDLIQYGATEGIFLLALANQNSIRLEEPAGLGLKKRLLAPEPRFEDLLTAHRQCRRRLIVEFESTDRPQKP
jgi:hypothetical protein